jgi:hypothetical protein
VRGTPLPSELGHGGVAPRVVACRRRAWRRGARVSTLTFVASVNPIVYLGATPMGIDTVSGATATEATVFGEPDEASVTPLPQLREADVTNTTKATALARLGMHDTDIAASFRELAGRVEMPLLTTAGPLATLEVEYDNCEADGPFECGERYESGRRKRRETLRPNQPLFD